MNNIINKFFQTGDKFMPEMYLRQPGFTYSAWDQKIKIELRSLWKQEIQILFTEMN